MTVVAAVVIGLIAYSVACGKYLFCLSFQSHGFFDFTAGKLGNLKRERKHNFLFAMHFYPCGY